MSNGQQRHADNVDVVIIGTGPAGATAAARLAARGRSVLALERQRFPRFHIGESMLPYMVAILEEMNLLERAKAAGYVVKRGAEFIFRDGDFRRVDFREQGPGRHHETFQVERSHFDNLLVEHARSLGALVVEDAEVQELLLDGERVVGVRYLADGRARSVRTPYVIDAGGRSSKVAQTFKLRRGMDRLRMIALYRHFTGLDERHNPAQEGDIQIGGHADGWVWAIPIWPDTISVGAVMPRALVRSATHERLFDEHVSRIPRIATRLTGTQPRSEVRVETDYCYCTDRLTGPGWFLVGDAGCFVDPIFSGGVFLAMVTGRTAADTVDEILTMPHRADQLHDDYERFYKTGYDTYARLIYAYYESEFNLGRYLRGLGVEVQGNPWFARLLSGDFWDSRNPIGEMLRGESRWDTFAPFQRVRNCPVYPDPNFADHAVAV